VGAVAGIELPEGDPGAVEQAAHALRKCAGGFERAAGTAARAAGSVGSWEGAASFNFRTHCGSYREAADAAAGAAERGAQALARYGRVLDEARERVRELQRRAEECLERIRAAEEAASDAAQRAAAASHMAYQASFLSGADAGQLRASYQQQADDAWGEQAWALDRAAEARDELERLRRQAQEERERAKLAASRSAGEVSSVEGGLPTVLFPGQAPAPATGSGARPTPPAFLLGRGGTPGAQVTAMTDEEREQLAAYEEALREHEGDGPPGIVTFAGDLLGINDAKQAGEDFSEGNVLGGLFHTALAWPGGKLLKLGKEATEEAGERIGREATEEAGERGAREGAMSGEDLRRAWKENAGSSASTKLGQNLETDPLYPMPRPDGYEAHHIVAAGDSKAAEAQKILQRLGVHPNEASNGVFLPGPTLKDKVPLPTEPFHRPIHTQPYYDRVALDLADATNADEARAILRDIRQQVLSGEYKGLQR
jgi:A nuclease family of the HNH/ENDO VII superfamily with conserved AHH